MGLIPPEVAALVGVWTQAETACDPVEAGAVRRFAQAIMDDDPAYAADAGADVHSRYGGPIAPPLFPNHMLRRPYGTPDRLHERAGADPDFDGVVPATESLPPLAAFAHLPVLNGGSEFEFYRYARHGESVAVRQRYASIEEKQTSKGSLIVVVIEAEIRTAADELLLRSRRTLLRRVP
ncbi:MAG TPA: MaoC family dehydratase N-terminal domain-containing protein [Ramlibacter sp.]|uniref:FAS1-like dehydratase domain-containing protein n=1 Tax=Ramlibacter sp. TaxID=1917967 RepID=UPI002C8CBB7F|nr:MaoC family dehydratase N-terminal domain-containing protein [Ramlibacter sp.]HVZ43597.1 MaoC family dehydratase N-terminal domain-containing protein [Ramlibacter sp.]